MLYEKWFEQSIPPSNAKLNLPPSAATVTASKSPDDRPVEDYAKK